MIAPKLAELEKEEIRISTAPVWPALDLLLVPSVKIARCFQVSGAMVTYWRNGTKAIAPMRVLVLTALAEIKIGVLEDLLSKDDLEASRTLGRPLPTGWREDTALRIRAAKEFLAIQKEQNRQFPPEAHAEFSAWLVGYEKYLEGKIEEGKQAKKTKGKKAQKRSATRARAR